MLLLHGCAASGNDAITGSIEGEASTVDTRRYAQRDEEAEARQLFAAGNFGLAEQKFRLVVEGRPDNAEAWIGLAATYDQLRRFDLAKRAYDQAIRLRGRTPIVLNNLGYHYYLQGQKRQAEQNWRMAAQMEPDNPKIQANLALLQPPPPRSR